MKKKSYYAIIPAKVRYCKELTIGARLLYGEITALCNQEGYCYASNQYFSDCYEIDSRTVRRWINSLEKNKFIRVEIKALNRKIYIMDDMRYEDCDEDGNPKAPKKEKIPKTRKDVTAKKLLRWFSHKCKKELDASPMMGMKEYVAVLRVMNAGGLSEKQIVNLFDEWFSVGHDPEIAISVLRALSNDQVSKYKTRHQIK